MATGQITTTLGALVEADAALERVLSVRLDAKTRYHAVKLAKLVRAETKHFYDERNAAVKELGVERPPTAAERAKLGPDHVTEVTPTNLAEFRARAEALAAVPVTLPWGPLTANMLDPYPEITGQDWLALGPLFELEPETHDASPKS